VRLGTSCDRGEENDVMGMLYNWVYQLTMPLRDLGRTLYNLQRQLLFKLTQPQRMHKMLKGDVRRIGGEFGVNKARQAMDRPPPKPPPPKPPPPKPPPRQPPKPPPRKR
jgi:hypothetical protein